MSIRWQWSVVTLWSGARTLLRLLVDTAGTRTHRWMPRSAPSSVWQALLTPEVVPMLAEVVWAWCWLSLVLTLLSPGVLPLPIIGLPSSDGISVPSADPREHGFVLLYPGSVSFFSCYAIFLFLPFFFFSFFFPRLPTDPSRICSNPNVV